MAAHYESAAENTGSSSYVISSGAPLPSGDSLADSLVTVRRPTLSELRAGPTAAAEVTQRGGVALQGFTAVYGLFVAPIPLPRATPLFFEDLAAAWTASCASTSWTTRRKTTRRRGEPL